MEQIFLQPNVLLSISAMQKSYSITQKPLELEIVGHIAAERAALVTYAAIETGLVTASVPKVVSTPIAKEMKTIIGQNKCN